MKRVAAIAIVLLAVAAGVALEHAFDLIGGPTGDARAADSGPKHVCPMHPEIVRAGPDACPICGMDLVPVDAPTDGGTGGGAHPTIWITPAVEQNLGVRTVAAARRALQRRIDTVGYVEYDRTKLIDVYAPAQGNINALSLRSEGERVKEGQFLFQLDSPTLSSYYDKTYAAQDGIVAVLGVIEGEFVTPRTKVLTLADLSSVWVLADVFEGQSHWVEPGQRAEVRLPSLPGRTWSGTVQYVYPNLDPETRTLRVRMRFDNPDEVLKPNMYAEVTILAGAGRDVLAVPREALIQTGKQQRVIVATGNGHYQPREVVVGMEQGDWVEIIEGLAEGDVTVVSGQFLLDSESSLKASLARLAAGP